MHRSIYSELKSCLEANQLVTLATVVAGPEPGNQMLIWPGGQTLGDLGAPRLNQRAADFAEQAMSSFESGRRSFRPDGDEIDVFFEVLTPPPELIVVGAVHVAIPLTLFARTLGYRTVIIDPRRAFATRQRFPDADLILERWPKEALAEITLHQACSVAVLSHDLKIDLPALEVVLRSPVRYIGALGSRKTHSKRITALRENGFTEEEIGRIHAPVGIDLGGRRAEEIALSIMAQIVAAAHGRA